MSIKPLPLFSLALLAGLVLFSSALTRAFANPPPPETVAYHPLTGKARFIGGQSGVPLTNTVVFESNASPETVARTFLTGRGQDFGLENQAQNLRVLRETHADNGARTVRFQQTFQGIPVVAGELIVQMNSGNQVLSASGEVLPDIALDVTPQIDTAAAAQSALEAVSKENAVSLDALQASTPELWLYNPALLTPFSGATVLTWRVQVSTKNGPSDIREMVLVNAKAETLSLLYL